MQTHSANIKLCKHRSIVINFEQNSIKIYDTRRKQFIYFAIISSKNSSKSNIKKLDTQSDRRLFFNSRSYQLKSASSDKM